MTQGSATLLGNPIQNIPKSNIFIGLYPSGGWNPALGPQFVAAFGDRNNNDLPDLVIGSGSGGNCCPSYLTILEIQPNGDIIDISPQASDVYPVEFIDLNHDGTWEIKAMGKASDFANVNTTHLYLIRLFGWDGRAYIDVSASYPDFYEADIQTFQQSLNHSTGCYPPDYFLERAILAYYAMGGLNGEWRTLRKMLKWDFCSTEELTAYGYAIGRVEQWVYDHSS